MNTELQIVDPVQMLAGTPDPDAVRAIEQLLLQLPQIDLHTTQAAHGGICSRAILIPAGTELTGAQTNLDNLCAVLGDIEVTTDLGPRRLTGFHLLPANRGAKRMGRTLAPTLWITMWRTDLTDPVAIEDEMTHEADGLQTRRQCINYAADPALEG
ncbi:hypothetical protein [Aquabacterium sp.]|uniref:hypothetical protein n=1 Tax=Aquabacterium sp. TaxID=1872578 RepID=UPI004037E7C7